MYAGGLLLELAAKAYDSAERGSESEHSLGTSAREQIEASQPAYADESQCGPGPAMRKNSRGRPPNLKRHRAIATVIAEYANEWKQHLPEIAERFDADRVELRKTDGWKETWTETQSEKPELVKKAIQDSLKAAKKYS
jgi:hypothetical protein